MSGTGFDDYVKDIPMEIGLHFFPKPEVRLPSIRLPILPDVERRLTYSFDSEHRARVAYQRFIDESEKAKAKNLPKSEEPQPTSKPSTPGPSTAPMPNEVLQPSRILPNTPSTSTQTPSNQPLISYEEFEGRASVFDDLELKSIDDRKALSQVLSSSSVTSENPPTNTPVLSSTELPRTTGLPSYPSLTFGASEPNSIVPTSEPTISLTKTTVAYQSAPPSASHQAAKPSIATNGVDHGSTKSGSSFYQALRTRLETKGYRKNLIDAAIADVPKERVVHIEYYMKGMSMLEKRQVPVKKTLAYLLESGVTDKQNEDRNYSRNERTKVKEATSWYIPEKFAGNTRENASHLGSFSSLPARPQAQLPARARLIAKFAGSALFATLTRSYFNN